MTEPAPLRGHIKFFKSTEGYGIITDDHGGPDVFLHKTVCTEAGVFNVQPGTAVEYEYTLRQGRGRRARWIRIREETK